MSCYSGEEFDLELVSSSDTPGAESCTFRFEGDEFIPTIEVTLHCPQNGNDHWITGTYNSYRCTGSFDLRPAGGGPIACPDGIEDLEIPGTCQGSETEFCDGCGSTADCSLSITAIAG